MRSTVFPRLWLRPCCSFLQCKTFGNHKIPDGWLIVAAGNPPEYNKSVREFDVVTMDRDPVRSKWSADFERHGESMHMPMDCIRQ